MLSPVADATSNAWTVSLPHGEARVYRLETSVAFLTGLQIDIAPSPTDEATTTAATDLCATSHVPFRAPALPEVPGERFYGIETQVHGTSVLPSSIVEVDETWLLSQLGGPASVAGWQLAFVQTEIRDFGVGVAHLTWQAEAPIAATPQELEACTAALDARTPELLAPALGEIIREFRTILEFHPARLDPGPAFDRAASTQLPRPGHVLWVSSHCRATADSRRRVAEDLAELLCPNAATLLEHRDHVYAPGVARSVTCSRPGWESDAGTLTTVLPRQDAWWALYWALDRTLLSLQLDLVAETSTNVRALVDRSQMIAAIYERISLYGSRVDTALTSGGARELAVWQSLAKAWDLEFRMACVERKLTQIQRNYANAIASIQSTQTSRVSLMIFVFAAFSVMASAVAVVQYAASDKNGTLAFRIAILLALAALSLGAVAASFSARSRSLRSGLEGRPARRRQ